MPVFCLSTQLEPELQLRVNRICIRCSERLDISMAEAPVMKRIAAKVKCKDLERAVERELYTMRYYFKSTHRGESAPRRLGPSQPNYPAKGCSSSLLMLCSLLMEGMLCCLSYCGRSCCQSPHVPCCFLVAFSSLSPLTSFGP